MTALTVTLETRLKEFMLSLDFEMGDELLALVGRAGSGKTVILRSIAGVYVVNEEIDARFLGKRVQIRCAQDAIAMEHLP